MIIGLIIQNIELRLTMFIFQASNTITQKNYAEKLKNISTITKTTNKI
jgi:hypothetical protein